MIEGEYHWHKHDVEDEFFYVVEGKLLIDLGGGPEGRTVELAPGQGFVVPRGVMPVSYTHLLSFVLWPFLFDYIASGLPLRLGACRNNPCVFDHQDNRALRSARAVHHPVWHNESLTRRQFHRAALKPTLDIDQQFALDHIEELIFHVVLVPVVFALDHAHANH